MPLAICLLTKKSEESFSLRNELLLKLIEKTTSIILLKTYILNYLFYFIDKQILKDKIVTKIDFEYARIKAW
jgi:hypothetical protein